MPKTDYITYLISHMCNEIWATILYTYHVFFSLTIMNAAAPKFQSCNLVNLFLPKFSFSPTLPPAPTPQKTGIFFLFLSLCLYFHIHFKKLKAKDIKWRKNFFPMLFSSFMTYAGFHLIIGIPKDLTLKLVYLLVFRLG